MAKWIFGTRKPDKLNGSKKADNIYGYQKNDKLYGKDGNDYLNGGDGNDKLMAGNGKDKLEGGPGKDKLIGGKTGVDEARYKGKKKQYKIIEIGMDKYIIKPKSSRLEKILKEGTDILRKIEQVR